MKKNNKNRSSNGLRSFGNMILGLFSPKKRNEAIEEQEKNILEEEAIESPIRSVIKKFFKNPLGVIGLIGFILLIVVVFVGSLVLPFDPYYASGAMKNIAPGTGYMDVPDQLLNDGVKHIESGTTFSVGLSEEGNIYFWGLDSAGNLQMPEEIRTELEGKNIDQIAVGDRHILVLTDNDEIYGWGNNSFEQTIVPSDIQRLIDEEGVQKIGAGDQYSVVLTDEGTIKVWGSTLPNNLNLISSSYDQNVVDFATGSVNILVQTKDNEMKILGTRGSELDTDMPEELAEGQVEVVNFARAQRSGAAIDADGKLWAWGSSTENAQDAPVDVDEKFVEVEAGRSHMIARTESGKLYSWGNAEYGVTDSPEDDGYVEVFADFYSNYAFKDKSTYTSWGLGGFLMGTDELGRDLFTRLIHGGKATLSIALVATLIQVVLGVVVGLIAGYYGGWVDNALMRFAEIIGSFPFYPTLITLSATLPADATEYDKIYMTMILLGILSWTGIARLVRGQILSEREKDYVTAARSLGLREGAIMVSHILPNVVSIVIVNATLSYASNLLSEAGLSFLGFGVPEPFPSWGNMMSSAQSIDVIETYWWRWIFPGIAVFAAAFTVNLIGDALRDALDPKSSER